MAQPTQRKAGRLTEGPVGRHLLRLVIPSVIGLLAVIGFEVADTWFVAQLGTTELAALSFCFPIISLFLFISIGLGVGTSSVVSRAVGEGSHEQVQRLATDAVILGALVLGILGVIGHLTIDPVFTLLGAGPEHLPHIREYMTIWYSGAPLLGMMLTGNNAIRGTGDSLSPSTVMVVAGLVNVVLDPLLIFGLYGFPRLGLEGAAIATVAARAAGLAVTFYILFHREKLLCLNIPSRKRIRRSWRQLAHIAGPAALGFAFAPIAMAIITRMISEHGEAAVAGFGVATRLEGLIVVVIIALSSATIPLVGQNWGAGRMDRVAQVLRLAFAGSIGWGILSAGVMYFAAEPLAAGFDDNPETVAQAALYLSIVPLSYGLLGLLMISAQAANGMARPGASLAMRMGREFVLFVPLAWIGSQLGGVEGMFIGIAFAFALSGILAASWVQMQGWISPSAAKAQIAPAE